MVRIRRIEARFRVEEPMDEMRAQLEVEEEAGGVEARLAVPKPNNKVTSTQLNRRAAANIKARLNNRLARIDGKLARVVHPGRRKKLEQRRDRVERRLARKLARVQRRLARILAVKNANKRPEMEIELERQSEPPHSPVFGGALSVFLRSIYVAIDACQCQSGLQLPGDGAATDVTQNREGVYFGAARNAPGHPDIAVASAPDSTASVGGDDSVSNSDSSDAGDTDDSSAEDATDDFFHGPAAELKGRVLGDKYRVVRELGKGTFGRVVECYDIGTGSRLERVGLGGWRGALRSKTTALYAIKVIRNVARYVQDAEIEADMLREINATGGRGVELFPVLFEVFDLPSGSKCFVLEKLGMSLHDAIGKNDGGGLSIRFVREISIQLFDALDHLHSRGLIHTDLKTENILLVDNNANEDDVRIKVIDFGGAVFDKDNKGVAKTSIVNTRQYRAPEILLRIGWSFPSDIWAAGCTIAEVALGYQLFPAESSCEHLAMIEKRIESGFPHRMLLQGGPIAAKCFDRLSAKHLMEQVLKRDSLRYLDHECHPLEEEVGEDAVASGLCDLLGGVLTIDPWLRPKAKQALTLATSITCDDIYDK